VKTKSQRTTRTSIRWAGPVAALAATVAAAHLSVNLFSASLSIYLHRDLGFSVSAVGLVVGVTFAVQVLATVAVGPLLDRRGAILVLRIGPVLYLFAALAFVSSTNPYVIVLARVLQGGGIAMVLPSALTLVPNVVPDHVRGLAIGIVGTFQSVALALGPQLGIWLLGRSPGSLFIAAALAAVLAIGLSLRLSHRATGTSGSRLFKYRSSWTPLFTLAFLTNVYWGLVVAFLPINVSGSEIPAVGWFFTADAVGVLLCRLPVGFLSDRVSPHLLLAAGTVITTVSIVILLPPATLATLVLAGAASGLGAGLLISPNQIELQRRSDNSDRGTAMALWSTSFAAAVGIGTIGAAPLVDNFGFHAALIISAVFCLSGLLVVFKLRPVRPQPSE
jgi:MFS family permease